jgi:hypothetical protein
MATTCAAAASFTMTPMFFASATTFDCIGGLGSDLVGSLPSGAFPTRRLWLGRECERRKLVRCAWMTSAYGGRANESFEGGVFMVGTWRVRIGVVAVAAGVDDPANCGDRCMTYP